MIMKKQEAKFQVFPFCFDLKFQNFKFFLSVSIGNSRPTFFFYSFTPSRLVDLTPLLTHFPHTHKFHSLTFAHTTTTTLKKKKKKKKNRSDLFYKLTMTAQGSSLHCELENANSEQVLASLDATDSKFADGGFAVMALLGDR